MIPLLRQPRRYSPFGPTDPSYMDGDDGTAGMADIPPTSAPSPPAPPPAQAMPPPAGALPPMNAPPPAAPSGPPPSPALDFGGGQGLNPEGDAAAPSALTNSGPPPGSPSGAQPKPAPKPAPEMPDMPEAPKDNWAQRLARAVLSLNPRRSADDTTALLHPKYAGQMRQYQRQVGAMEEQQKLAKGQSEIEREQAQSKMYEQHGQYWADRGQQERNRFHLDPKSGMMYDTQTGQIIQAPKTLMDKINEYKQAGYSDDDARALAVGQKPDQKQELTPETGQRLGIKPDAQGRYFIQASQIGSIYRTDNPVEKPQVTAEQRAAAIAIGADPNDPTKWSKQQAAQILDRTKPPREPRQPSAAELTRQDRKTVTKLADRAIRDSNAQGGTSIDDAIRNVNQFYLDDPDMSQYRGDVVKELEQRKILQNRANAPAKGRGPWQQRIAGTGQQPPGTPSGKPAPQPQQKFAPNVEAMIGAAMQRGLARSREEAVSELRRRKVIQ